jgi:hypothetical protein
MVKIFQTKRSRKKKAKRIKKINKLNRKKRTKKEEKKLRKLKKKVNKKSIGEKRWVKKDKKLEQMSSKIIYDYSPKILLAAAGVGAAKTMAGNYAGGDIGGNQPLNYSTTTSTGMKGSEAMQYGWDQTVGTGIQSTQELLKTAAEQTQRIVSQGLTTTGEGLLKLGQYSAAATAIGVTKQQFEMTRAANQQRREMERQTKKRKLSHRDDYYYN